MRRLALITARKTAGKSQEKVAEQVGVDRTTVGTWERGEHSPRPDQRLPYAEALGISLEELDGLLTGLPTNGGTPLWLRQYLGLEQSADSIRTHEPHVVHGLLQTPAYTAAIARSIGVSPTPESYVERNVEQRAERQARVVEDGGLRLHVVQSELALRLLMGDEETMLGQLDHLVSVAHWGNVTLQVVPFDVGQYEALRVGAMDIMTHSWAEGVSVWVQRYGDATLVDDVDEAGHLVAVFEHAAGLALSPEESIAFMADMADQWRNRT